MPFKLFWRTQSWNQQRSNVAIAIAVDVMVYIVFKERYIGLENYIFPENVKFLSRGKQLAPKK